MKTRINGSRKGALVSAAAMGLPIPFVVLLVSAGTGFTAYNGLLFLPGIAILFRASRMGIFLHEDHIEIISWYRTYLISKSNVSGVSLMPYSGLLNRNAESGIDPVWLFCRMLSVETPLRKKKEYPSTISSRSTAENIADEIGLWAGLPPRRHSSTPKHR